MSFGCGINCVVLQMSEHTWTYEAAFAIQPRQGALLNSGRSPGEVTASFQDVGVVFNFLFFFFFCESSEMLVL